jgi:hypothetical protein
MGSKGLSSIVSSVDSYQFNATSRAPCSNLGNSNSSSSSGKVAGSDVIVLLWQILGPILLLVGFTGNILVLITMTRRRMRGTSTYVYLVGMAAIDLIVLTVSVLPAWLDGSNIFSIKVKAGFTPLYKWKHKHVARVINAQGGDLLSFCTANV